MAYVINLSNGNLLTTIANTTVDNTTSLTLLGRNYAGYGTIVADNFVHSLENFANSTPPSNPLTGQLWFNTTTGALNVWSGTAWGDVGSLVNTILIQETTADNAGLTLYDPLAPSGSRYYRFRIRDDAPYSGHLVLESLNNDQSVHVVILDTDNAGDMKLAVTPTLSDSSKLIATTEFVKEQNYAPLASPAFTGTPTAPTPSNGDNTTKIATTAFVKNQGYAPLLSPVFIGAPAINGSGSGAVLELQGDGSNPNKFIRASLGHFQVVNSANTVVLLDVNDAGNLVATGTIQATGEVITNTSGGAVIELVGNGGVTPIKFVRAVSGHFQVVNSANTVVILDLDDTGVLNTNSAIVAGGAITATGAVTASGGRLRASFGAYGSGDPNAATLLADFATLFAGDGYCVLPNGLILQWGQNPSGGVADRIVFYPLAFPNSILGLVGTPVNTAPSYASIDAFGSLTGFAVHMSDPVNFDWFAIGF